MTTKDILAAATGAALSATADVAVTAAVVADPVQAATTGGPQGYDARPPEPEDKPLTRGQKLRLVGLVILKRLRFIAILAGVGLFIGYWDTVKNYWDKWTQPQSVSTHELAPGQEFYCPMDPQVIRSTYEPNGDVPKCPICGMPLSIRKKGQAATLPAGITGRVQISPERIQLAGIKTTPVEYRPMAKQTKTVGYVAFDESRLSRIVSRVDGYVEKLYVDKTFTMVQKGDPLAEIYSPELYSTARELLLATRGVGGADLASAARNKLLLLGVSQREIDGIAASGQPSLRLVIRSPQEGFVVDKKIVVGASVDAKMTLFEVADLSTVWVEADVYEKDIPYLRPGQEVEATVEAYPNHTFAGKLALIYPQLDIATRTNRIRVELANPQQELRPGMFATVQTDTPLESIEPYKSLVQSRAISLRERARARAASEKGDDRDPLRISPHPNPLPKGEGTEVPSPLPKREETVPHLADPKGVGALAATSHYEFLVVPERAVIDTGSKKVVYVEREPGMFEGVEVELGPRQDNYYPVLAGLKPGDKVAAAGGFLIDAETRLNPAAAATYFGASGGPQSSSRPATPASPIAGSKTAAPSPLPPQLQSGSAGSPPTPDAEELKNINQLPETDRKLALAQRECPITGASLGSMGVPVKVMLRGQPVFLCCQGCVGKAKKDPDGTLRKVAELRVRSRP
jgi:Cu(I)/Ag(I) efflux system membrane fusion protein